MIGRLEVYKDEPKTESTGDVVEISIVEWEIFPCPKPCGFIPGGGHQNVLPPEEKI